MWLSARVDYAVRIALEMAAAAEGPVKAADLAARQQISESFTETILADLKRAGIVASRRGRGGGHVLARPASEITVADIMRVELGNLADVRGQRPEEAEYPAAAEHLTEVWVAARAAYRDVLESVSLADVVAGRMPEEVTSRLHDPAAWRSYPNHR